MKRIRQHPLFFAAWAVCLAAIAIEAALLGQAVVRTRHALKLLVQKKQEREALVHVSPVPSEASQQAIEAELKNLNKTLAELRAKLAPADAAARDGAAQPATSLEAYFAISQFVEATRALAVERQVTLKADERFGMASYLNEGPETALVPAINQQRLVLQEMLGALLAAGPHELLSVRRQRLAGSDASTSGDSGTAMDYFAPTRLPGNPAGGSVRTQAFQVEFVGHTRVLRDFLNAVASSRLPLLVRNLEAEPVELETLRDEKGAGIPRPVVPSPYSRFSVTIDFVELQPALLSSL